MRGDKLRQARLALLIFAAFIVSACQPTLTPVARPTPQVIVAEVTPALQPLREQFSACADEISGAGLVLTDTAAGSLNPTGSAIALRWGPGAEMPGFTAVIGQETLEVIVHPRNPLQSITLAQLQAIYSGALKSWPETTPPAEIKPWAYPEGDDVQRVFQTSQLKGRAPSTRAVYTAPDPAAAREAVAADQNAIAFVPRRWVDSSVKMLTITGADPASLSQPILAWSKAEPTGVEKSWLLCVQERLK